MSGSSSMVQLVKARPPYIIDTCVALKWYVPEADAAAARLYMGLGIDRYAPDLLPIEAAHALIKRVRSRDDVWRDRTSP